MHRLLKEALMLDLLMLYLLVLRVHEVVQETVIDWVTNDVQVVFQSCYQGVELVIQCLV